MILTFGKVSDTDKKTILNSLKSVWCCSTGGFAGGPGQIPHLAPTYAAVMALISLGKDGYDIIDRFVCSCSLSEFITRPGNFLASFFCR